MASVTDTTNWFGGSQGLDNYYTYLIKKINYLNITESKLKRIVKESSGWGTTESYLLIFENSEKKYFKTQKNTMYFDIGEWLIEQLKNELPYMDKKMREIHNG